MTEQGGGVTRRQVLAGAAAVGLGAAAAPQAAQGADPAELAHGTVFDADSAGRPGVAGVMVSNGEDVVLTDADGRWQLPLADGESVFVVKPRGWMVPVDPERNLPRAAYVHAPAGTPAALGLRFRGLAPTGPLPASIDFALRRQDEGDAFTAVLLTDPQPESLAELDFVRLDVLGRIATEPAAFGITLGDIMFDDLAFYEQHNRLVGTLGLPWWNLPGNHDMNFEAPGDQTSRETFKRMFGARRIAFQYGPATFILLDNVEYLGADAARPNGAGKYRGRFGARQLAFVRNVLANVPLDQLVVLCFHIPLRTAVGSEPAIAATDAADLLAAIGPRANCISFAGHTHTNEHHYLGAADGVAAGEHHHHVLAAGSGSWWSGPFDDRGIPVALQSDGCPNGFHLLDVDGTNASTRFIATHDPNQGQLRLVLDAQLHGMSREVVQETPARDLLAGPVAAAALGSTRLVANLFDGGPRSTMQVQFGRTGSWQAMTRTARADPFVEEVYARFFLTKKPWVQPVASTHLWQTTLPEDLPAGAHRVSVRAADEQGRTHQATMLIEVTT
jgi:3',5'-cyclic AMP phosphodiesterase CpdA